jgi:hypothetical protein
VKVIAGRRGSSSWTCAWDGVGRERRSLISWRIRRETRAFVAVPNKGAYQVVWRYNNRSFSAVAFDKTAVSSRVLYLDSLSPGEPQTRYIVASTGPPGWDTKDSTSFELRQIANPILFLLCSGYLDDRPGKPPLL